jgi:hypothetical protein
VTLLMSLRQYQLDGMHCGTPGEALHGLANSHWTLKCTCCPYVTSHPVTPLALHAALLLLQDKFVALLPLNGCT